MSETEQMETAPNNELIQVDFRDGPDSTTTPTRLKEIRENFVNKKSKRKEFDSFSDEDVSILDSKKSKKMDTPALRGKVVGLELDIIKYEKTIEELIEIAESLQKDNEKLSKYMNDQLNHINSKIKQVDEREKSRSKEFEEVKKRVEDLESLDKIKTQGFMHSDKSWASVVQVAESRVVSAPLNRPIEQIEIINSVSIEQKERDKKRKNVIILNKLK